MWASACPCQEWSQHGESASGSSSDFNAILSRSYLRPVGGRRSGVETSRRGELTRVSLAADRPGIFPFLCGTHPPTMNGDLVVLSN
jgi:hypothetical protein